MNMAALYARVSTTHPQQDETMASQLDALMAYAHAHDYEISPHHIYLDESFRGASVDRPALDALRDAVAAGELEAMLILSPDRLARQFAYPYVVTEELEQAGGEVVFVRHGLGKTPAERMLQEMAGGLRNTNELRWRNAVAAADSTKPARGMAGGLRRPTATPRCPKPRPAQAN